MNIIFDLGGVVLNWTPEKIIGQFFEEEDALLHVQEKIFKHEDWNEFDRGNLETEILLQRISARTGMEIKRGHEFLNAVFLSLEPIPGTLELLYKLKAAGQRLFCLSNINLPALVYLKQTYAFWEVFHGCVFSCFVKMIKPEEGIYKYLLSQYDLNPHDCLFFDDTQVNIEAAGKLGVRAVLFKGAADCEAQIVRVLSDSR